MNESIDKVRRKIPLCNEAFGHHHWLPEVPRLGADVFGQALDLAPSGTYIVTTALHRLGVRVR